MTIVFGDSINDLLKKEKKELDQFKVSPRIKLLTANERDRNELSRADPRKREKSSLIAKGLAEIPYNQEALNPDYLP